MRGLVIVNPTATVTTARVRDVLVRALSSEIKVDVAETSHRGHASELAAAARTDGFEIVVTLGGDGTVNETVGGLLADAPNGKPADTPTGKPAAAPGTGRPVLAVVPGGSANVFARALGLPRDPVEATGALLESVRAGRRRTIGLGRMRGRLADENTATVDRWFTFCAGLGLDAEVVRAVEEQRRSGARATPGRYLRTGVRQFFRTDRNHPALTLKRPDADPEDGLFMVVISNTTPWTYFGVRPVEPTPSASFDTGLDVFGLRHLGMVGTARHARRLLASGLPPVGRSVLSLHDQGSMRLRASRPIAVQIDGDYLGTTTAVDVQAVPRVLTVVC